MSSGTIYLNYVFLNSKTIESEIKEKVLGLVERVNELHSSPHSPYVPIFEHLAGINTLQVSMRGGHHLSTETILWCSRAVNSFQKWPEDND